MKKRTLRRQPFHRTYEHRKGEDRADLRFLIMSRTMANTKPVDDRPTLPLPMNKDLVVEKV